MDPNANTNLDPKLKDMYNKVMSTPVPPPVTAPSTATPPPAPEPITPSNPTTPQTSIPSAPTTPPETPTPPPPIPQPQPEAQPSTPIQSGPTTEMHASIPMPVAPKPVSAAIIGGATKNKKMNIIPVLLAFVGIIFLGVYTVFWIKFFNLNVPFLPF